MKLPSEKGSRRISGEEPDSCCYGCGSPRGYWPCHRNAVASEGSTVFVLDLEETTSDQMTSIVCDVSDRASVNTAIARILESHTEISVLINNAGVARGGDFLNSTETDWTSSVEVNLLGVVNVCQATIPNMTSGGRIINIASLAGLGAIDGIPACYTATKFAVVGLTKQLALELAPRGITCNALCPGSIKTQMHAQTLQQIAEQFEGSAFAAGFYELQGDISSESGDLSAARKYYRQALAQQGGNAAYGGGNPMVQLKLDSLTVGETDADESNRES